VFSSLPAHAQSLCEEEQAAVTAIVQKIADLEKKVLSECGEFRVCKGDARISKLECKQGKAQEIFACFQDCKLFRGEEKRQCKKDCRFDRRIGRLTCRNLALGDKTECREEKPECVGLWGDRAALIVEGVFVVGTLEACIRKAGDKVETEEDEENRQDLEEADEAASESGEEGKEPLEEGKEES
jgi:hypothetical protein